MKLRFVVTLLAVAIAAIGTTAQAVAPTIGEIRSPVISDEGATGVNPFVYPDALDLNALASDDTVASSDIIWSFTGTGRYIINGVAPSTPGTDNLVNPTTKRVDNQDSDPGSVDANTRTITFRDATLSPIGSPTAANPGTGIIASEVVTLFASDGTTFSQKSFMVYTESGGVDRLSPGGPTSTPELNVDFGAATPSGWTSSIEFGAPTVTLAENTNGLCINVPLTGVNWGTWTSPFGDVALGKNKVFRIRLNLGATTNLPANTTPLWTFAVDNFNPANFAQQDNKFGGELISLDGEGSANSPGLTTGGRHDFELWYAPPSVVTTDWNDATNGMFTAAREGAGRNGMRFQYRILDLKADLLADNDAGNLCLKTLVIDSFDINDLTVKSTVSNVTDMNASNFSVVPIVQNINPATFPTTTISFTGGDITVNPNTAGTLGQGAWDTEVIDIQPGDTTVNPGVPATLLDNWPIKWESDKLLKMTTGIRGSSATTDTNPPDALILAADEFTNEVIVSSNVASTINTLGMPKNAAAQSYVLFFYTHNKTASLIGNADGIRPRVQIINNGGILSGGSARNLGGVVVTEQKVEEIEQP
jgi:hypothetical protein